MFAIIARQKLLSAFAQNTPAWRDSEAWEPVTTIKQLKRLTVGFIDGAGVVWDQQYKQGSTERIYERTSHMPKQLTPEIISAAIAGFEQQKTHIDAQIAELRAMLSGGSTETITTPEPTKRKRRKMSAAGRARIADAQRKRWAASKKAAEPSAPATSKPKRKLSKARRAALVANLAKARAARAAKRAEAAKPRSVATKKAAVKRAAVKTVPAKAAKKAAPAKKTAARAKKVTAPTETVAQTA
jgi:hypothetical protein